MKKVLIFSVLSFCFLSASAEPSSYEHATFPTLTFYAAPVDREQHQQVQLSVHAFSDSPTHYLNALQLELQRMQYFQQLRNVCLCNNIDVVWADPQAHNVYTRCMVINFLNGPSPSWQRLKPSPLPLDFYECFDSVGWVMGYLWSDASVGDYYESFFNKLANKRILEGSAESLPHERAEMRQWGYYEYEGYRSFLKRLPAYEEYMLEIAAQFQHDAEFAKLVREASPSAAVYIPQEAQRIRHKKAEEERKGREAYLCNQRQQCAQQLFVQQQKQLSQKAALWETAHPERAIAYHKALAEKGVHSQRSYHLSSIAQTTLQKVGIAAVEYAHFSGNSLQHELMHEIVTGIEHGVQITQFSQGSFEELLRNQSLHLFDNACQANQIGDSDGTSQLVDVGNQLLDCCKAFLKGTADGIQQGTIDAVIGTAEMIRHPIKTIRAITETATMLVHVAHDYIPTLPDRDLSLEEYDAYLNQCDAAEQKWCAAVTQLKQKWRETPTPELVYQVTQGTTSMATNIFVAHGCGKLVATVARSIRPVIAQVVTKLKRSISYLELQAAAPGCLLFSNSAQIAQICEAVNISIELLKDFHSNFMKIIEQEIAILRPLFDNRIKGFAEFANKYLKLDYAHILGMELIFDGNAFAKINGFHHDFMNAIESSGMIKFVKKVMGKDGIYKADLQVAGKTIRDKTFFPAHWSRAKVVSAIYEAYENCIEVGKNIERCRDGKYKLTGRIQEGIEIQIFVTPKGKITTAYPLA